jgi:hypothetical protein
MRQHVQNRYQSASVDLKSRETRLSDNFRRTIPLAPALTIEYALSMIDGNVEEFDMHETAGPQSQEQPQHLTMTRLGAF